MHLSSLHVLVYGHKLEYACTFSTIHILSWKVFYYNSSRTFTSHCNKVIRQPIVLVLIEASLPQLLLPAWRTVQQWGLIAKAIWTRINERNIINRAIEDISDW